MGATGMAWDMRVRRRAPAPRAAALAVVLEVVAWGVIAQARDVGGRTEAAMAPLRLKPRQATAPATPTIDFSELYLFGPRAPELTAKARALHGRPVTLVGFMVVLERPVSGGFYLASSPAVGDESGAGRGDLPTTAILVLPRAAVGREIAFVPGALEVTGVLDIGNRSASGEASSVRVLVDDMRQLRLARVRRPARTARVMATTREKTTTEKRRGER